MLVAAAMCPCPPLLVPEVASGAAAELDSLRAACDEALRTVLAAGPDLIAVVGTGASTAVHEQGTPGSFRPYGVDLDVRLGLGDAAGELPLSLTVGAWLLERAGWTGAVRGLEVPDGNDWPANGEHGVHVSEWAPRLGMLVMGDGSARRSLKAPGYLDDRAEALDAEIAAALANNDSDGFFPDLDATTARELMVSGRSPWQVLCGAAREDFRCRLLYEDAPYGVGYFVATWSGQ
ncbi:class III extradiol dioxygenase subunit B-like domain-containing protein [Streptomyces sp. NBC_01142]|uniref:class III extradiol dioxygenase subunit B-like domain-containing protein n=1 Tax=Streptomyces sp. NBC_01142 TaxID=2975865 RepID=UPI00225470F4|nr:class III extradiol dioxygenase subunit B-like domain-containing protein [Streptomyces sp. NBC_01142]MCX4819801.1 class III extradiol dioxygenase subunit B-like domain-containing protein [Streptomyces sp. NBC_01142]